MLKEFKLLKYNLTQKRFYTIFYDRWFLVKHFSPRWFFYRHEIYIKGVEKFLIYEMKRKGYVKEIERKEKKRKNSLLHLNSWWGISLTIASFNLGGSWQCPTTPDNGVSRFLNHPANHARWQLHDKGLPCMLLKMGGNLLGCY